MQRAQASVQLRRQHKSTRAAYSKQHTASSSTASASRIDLPSFAKEGAQKERANSPPTSQSQKARRAINTKATQSSSTIAQSVSTNASDAPLLRSAISTLRKAERATSPGQTICLDGPTDASRDAVHVEGATKTASRKAGSRTNETLTRKFDEGDDGFVVFVILLTMAHFQQKQLAEAVAARRCDELRGFERGARGSNSDACRGGHE